MWQGRWDSTRGGEGEGTGLPLPEQKVSAPRGVGRPPVDGTTCRCCQVWVPVWVPAFSGWCDQATKATRGRCGRRLGACVREAVRPSYRPGPHDPPAKRHLSLVPGGLKAHTRGVCPRALGGWQLARRGVGSCQAYLQGA